MPRRKKIENQEPTQPEPKQYYENPAKLWMWVGVLSIMTIIIIFWAWGMKNQISMFRWDSTPDAKLFKSAQNDLEVIFNEENKLKAEQTKQDLKAIIDKVVTELNSSTKSVEFTTTTNSSTTINATSTN